MGVAIAISIFGCFIGEIILTMDTYLGSDSAVNHDMYYALFGVMMSYSFYYALKGTIRSAIKESNKKENK